MKTSNKQISSNKQIKQISSNKQIKLIDLRYAKWLYKLNVTKLTKSEDEIARMISSGEFIIEDNLAPLYESGKLISEKTLASNILKSLDVIRKKVTSEFESKYGKAKKNPQGSLRDQKIAKEIAQSYRIQIDDKIKNGLTKKQAIEAMLTSWKSISATESSRVVNEQRDFLLSSYPGEKSWNAVLDHKTCLDCKKLDGKTISTSGDFKLNGKIIKPPLHPYCRCFIEYKIKSKNK